MFAGLKRIWSDPVWSKVISVAILAAVGWAAAAWKKPIGAAWRNHPAADPWMVAGSIVLLIAFGAMLSATRTRLDAEIKVTLDSLANAPWILVIIHNRSWKRVLISALEFRTLNQWDIPNLRWMGSSRPTATFLSPHAHFLQVSPDRGSVSRLGIDKWVRGRRFLHLEFRLTTQHAPADGFGLFPFHLGVELIHGASESRLRLKDVVASVNGRMPTSGVETGGPLNLAISEPGELMRNAGQALRIIEGGACANEKTAQALREFTGSWARTAAG